MKKQGNKFKDEMKGLQALHGRKLSFVIATFGISKQWFHRRLNAEDFDEQEQTRLKEIIITGK